MLISRRLLLAAFVTIPAAVEARAHDQPEHGGQIQKIGKFEGELVFKGGEIVVYLLDENDNKIDASKFSATAVVLAKGNEQKTVALAPGGDNKLVGKVEFAVDGKFRAAVTLKTGGKEVGKARYNLDLPR